jgi:hypothetical protein
MSLPGGKVAKYAILIMAIAAMLIPIIVIENNVLQHTQGNVTYPRDNVFVNLTVARNLAFNEVWGITKYSFQFASSSPLYTILLALVYFLAGSSLVIPLIINGLTAIFLLFMVQRWLICRGLPPGGQLLILLLVIFLAPLPLLVISGTEHTLQLLLSFLFISTFAEAAMAGPSQKATTITKLPRWVYIYGALMVLSGYECSVIALVACGFLLWRHQRSQAAKLAAAAFLPILLLGLLSISKGGYFLPNPLLLDSATTTYSEAFLLGNTIIVVGVLLAYYGGKSRPRRRPAMARRALIPVLVLLAILSGFRNTALWTNTGQDCIDLYHQQYQTAKFVHRYYNRYGIALNEPGAISYWSEGWKLDLTGAADHTVMRSKRTNNWSPAMADSLSRKENIRIAILSDPSINSVLPQRWSKVASWKTPNSTRAGYGSVSFYVSDTFSIKPLQKNLRDYQPFLPAKTVVRYY